MHRDDVTINRVCVYLCHECEANSDVSTIVPVYKDFWRMDRQTWQAEPKKINDETNFFFQHHHDDTSYEESCFVASNH